MSGFSVGDGSSFAERLRRGQRVVGLILKMPAPVSVEVGGYLGFDFVIVDTEHGIGGGAELEHHLRAADAAGVSAIVRVSTLNRTEIARALDGGAAGIVVPQVDMAEQAEAAVRLAHYPPLGERGLATSTRAGHHGTIPAAQHLSSAAENTVVVVQIESRAGVANAREILAVDGVSAVWVGLNDLSLELGYLGDTAHPDVADAIETVVRAAADAGKPLLVIADTEADGVAWADRGAQGLLINLLTILTRGLSGLHDAHRTTQNERELA